MKLLQTEIDIEPGRPAQQPVREGQVGAGCAILRIVNETRRENAYTVRLKCDNPYWRKEWFKITSIPGPIPADGAAVTARADVHGPQGKSMKVYLTTGGTRDIQISFYVPETPSSRVGKYRVSVVVETQIIGPATEAERNARISEIPAIVIVRPYYKWSADVSPEEGCRVGFFRRKASLEIVVTNEGNDWLYCDIRTQGQKDVLLEVPARVLAVPPPAPEVDARSTRSAPLDARTRLRAKIGDPIRQLLPLTLARIDAPSVAPRPVKHRFDLMSSTGSGAAVIAVPTTDGPQTQGDRTLKYHPIIPGTVAGATVWVVQNIKGLVAFALMLVVLIPLVIFFVDATIRPISVTALDLETMNGNVTIRGTYVVGGRIFYTVKDSPDASKNGQVSRPLTILAFPNDPTNVSKGWVNIPSSYNPSTIIFNSAQRQFFIPQLSALLSVPVDLPITYGTPPPPEDGNIRIISIDVRHYDVGERFKINKTAGKPWPTDPNSVTVLVDRNDAHAAVDANGVLWATVPDGNYTFDAQPVKVELADGSSVADAHVLIHRQPNIPIDEPLPDARQLLHNPGFEDEADKESWTASPNVISKPMPVLGEPAHSGIWAAALCGYTTPHTNPDTLEQHVVIPQNITRATLTFWIRIRTRSPDGTPQDTLEVQVRNEAGTVLQTLHIFTNADENNAYTQYTYDLSDYRGQPIVLYFIGKQVKRRWTAFFLDDFDLTVQ